MKRLFGWARLMVSDRDREESTAAMARAKEVREIADRLSNESGAVGARQRQLRQENHFGRSLDHVFRGAT